MNCKPGDLAVMVRSNSGNHGRLVEVVSGDYESCEGWIGVRGNGPLWRCNPLGRPLNSNWGPWARPLAIPDAWLRPIRPGDISDEEVRDLYSDRTKEAA